MTVLILFITLFAAANVVKGAEEILFSQLIHRHGSRSPIVPANASILCPPSGCGVLNVEGIDMLTKLGSFVKEHYSSAGYFPSDNYDFNTVYTRSTAIPRTIQSADSFLRGVFPTISTNYPVIFNVPKIEDTTLLSDSWPNFFFYMQANLQNFYKELTPLRESFFTDAVMANMASELSLEGFCASKGYTACAVVFFDIAASYEAIGTLTNYPTVYNNYASIKKLALAYFKMVFAFDSSKESDRLRGSPGQPVAQAILTNFKQYIADAMPYKFIEYSAHDSTISPLGVTIGDTSDSVYLTDFGIMMSFDLVKDGSLYYVRGIKGSPEQTPGNHTYSTSPLRLGGIDVNGRTYFVNGSSDRILFDDFVRFVDSTKPTSPDGQCAVPSDYLDALGCTASGVPTSTICLMFRTNCPLNACSSGQTLSFIDYSCNPAPNKGSSEASMTTANAGVMAMCTAFGGMLIGAGAMFAINLYNKRRALKDYDTIQENMA